MTQAAPDHANYNASAKLDAIADFFDDAEQRAAFLLELHASGHPIEASTLCLTYIDSFSQWLYWPRNRTGQNFVEALAQHGGDPELSLIHPLALTRAFDSMKGHWNDFATRLRGIFPGPAYVLYASPDFLTHASSGFNGSETKLIEAELWRGSIANVAYTRLRNPSIHSFRRAAEVSFDLTTYKGQPVQPITFRRLHQSLLGIVAEARARSMATGKWFGNDRAANGA